MKINNTKNEFLKQQFLIIPEAKTFFNNILDIATELVKLHPEILLWIKNDQDKFAKNEKLERLLDNRFIEEQTMELISKTDTEKSNSKLKREDLTLETGSPRMQPIIVFLFFIFRCYYGSFCKKKEIDRLFDSMTVYNWFLKYGVSRIPSVSAILQNVNKISNETREKIFTLQCDLAYDENLDDFETSIMDSTSVAANTSFPTDVSILRKLLKRSYHNLKTTCKILLIPLPTKYFDGWFEELNSLVFEIEMGKLKGKDKKRKAKELLEISRKIQKRLSDEQKRLQLLYSKKLPGFLPSQQKKIEKKWAGINKDLEMSISVAEYTSTHLIEGEKTKSKDKILSVSDDNVGFIIKGSLRSAVIGYKPQLVRSGNGIITAMNLTEGNVPDSVAFKPTLKEDFERTKKVSRLVNTDDGYTSKANFEWAQETNIEILSCNGINGRKLTSDEDWESTEYMIARSDRSTVEGLISTLKLVYNFGKVCRRGIENVRAEMLEKVIAYNFYRIQLLRKRKHKVEMKLAA